MLNPRLQLIFDVAGGPELWDIGCDHGLLAQRNQKIKKFSRVVCVDRSPNVIERLVGRIPESDRVLASGEDLDWGQIAGTVVMCGFGAENMIKIVSACDLSLSSKLQWILSPQNSVEWFDRQFEGRLGKTHVLDLLWVNDGRVRRPVFVADPISKTF